MMLIDKDVDDLEVLEIYNIIEELNVDLTDNKLSEFITAISSDMFEKSSDYMINQLSSKIDEMDDQLTALRYIKKIMNADGLNENSEKEMILKLKNIWDL